MFNTKILFKAICLSTALLAENLMADEYVIAIPSTVQSSADKQQLIDAIKTTVLSVPAGDNVWLINATNNRTIEKFTIPNNKAYKYSKVRKKQFRKQFKKVDGSITVGASEDMGKLLLPQFLNHISSQLFPKSLTENEKINVLLYGDALYNDSRDAVFSMESGWFPSDGHIKQSQRGSIYGTLERGNILNNFHIHFNYSNPAESWFSTRYKNRIERFWSLFVASMGGTLATFSPDLRATTERFLQTGMTSTKSYSFDHTANKIERLKLWAVPANNTVVNEVKVNEVIDENTSQPPSCLSENVAVTRAAPNTTKANNIIIGIRWDNCERCDLDLYATTNANQWLSYKNTKTAQGKYFKDFTSAPNVNGLEFVQLTKPTKFSDLKAMVNLYAGTSTSQSTGTLRICFDGSIYENKFNLSRASGDGGKNINSASDSAQWTVLNIPQILGVR